MTGFGPAQTLSHRILSPARLTTPAHPLKKSPLVLFESPQNTERQFLIASGEIANSYNSQLKDLADPSISKIDNGGKEYGTNHFCFNTYVLLPTLKRVRGWELCNKRNNRFLFYTHEFINNSLCCDIFSGERV